MIVEVGLVENGITVGQPPRIRGIARLLIHIPDHEAADLLQHFTKREEPDGTAR